MAYGDQLSMLKAVSLAHLADLLGEGSEMNGQHGLYLFGHAI